MTDENIVKKVCAEFIKTMGLGVMIYGFIAVDKNLTTGHFRLNPKCYWDIFKR